MGDHQIPGKRGCIFILNDPPVEPVLPCGKIFDLMRGLEFFCAFALECFDLFTIMNQGRSDNWTCAGGLQGQFHVSCFCGNRFPHQ